MSAVCPPGPTQNECQSKSRTSQKGAVLAQVAPGFKGQVAVNRFINAF
jgi:hypothetical protein